MLEARNQLEDLTNNKLAVQHGQLMDEVKDLVHQTDSVKSGAVAVRNAWGAGDMAIGVSGLANVKRLGHVHTQPLSSGTPPCHSC